MRHCNRPWSTAAGGHLLLHICARSCQAKGLKPCQALPRARRNPTGVLGGGLEEPFHRSSPAEAQREPLGSALELGTAAPAGAPALLRSAALLRFAAARSPGSSARPPGSGAR